MAVVAPGTPMPNWQLIAGAPCWIELSTTAPQEACDFYAGLFGWEYRIHRESVTGEHTIAYNDGYPVASVCEAAPGKGSEWRLYLATDSCANAIERARSMGSEVVHPTSTVPGVGTKAVLTSPVDAEFGLLQPEEAWQFDVGLPGTLMWAELVAIKAQAADQFFPRLFGYTAEQFGHADHAADYVVWYLGDESVLARVSMVRDYITPTTRPHWLLYLGADAKQGTDALMRDAVMLGGRVRVDPYDSSIGRVGVLRDPTGARFALIDPTQAVGNYATAANYDPYDD